MSGSGATDEDGFCLWHPDQTPVECGCAQGRNRPVSSSPLRGPSRRAASAFLLAARGVYIDRATRQLAVEGRRILFVSRQPDQTGYVDSWFGIDSRMTEKDLLACVQLDRGANRATGVAWLNKADLLAAFQRGWVAVHGDHWGLRADPWMQPATERDAALAAVLAAGDWPSVNAPERPGTLWQNWRPIWDRIFEIEDELDDGPRSGDAQSAPSGVTRHGDVCTEPRLSVSQNAGSVRGRTTPCSATRAHRTAVRGDRAA